MTETTAHTYREEALYEDTKQNLTCRLPCAAEIWKSLPVLSRSIGYDDGVRGLE